MSEQAIRLRRDAEKNFLKPHDMQWSFSHAGYHKMRAEQLEYAISDGMSETYMGLPYRINDDQADELILESIKSVSRTVAFDVGISDETAFGVRDATCFRLMTREEFDKLYGLRK